jgi:NADPH:quinone reductase-like Zn-dependent oxidoreductase
VAVQLAKWRGAHVIGTASGKNADYLAQIGVDEFIDYTTSRFEDAVSDVDLVFDAVGGETLSRSIAVVKPGGKLVSIAGQPSENDASTRGIEAHRILVHTSSDQLAQIADLIEQGVITPMVEHQLPLSEAREAHRLSEERHVRGKIVLVP